MFLLSTIYRLIIVLKSVLFIKANDDILFHYKFPRILIYVYNIYSEHIITRPVIYEHKLAYTTCRHHWHCTKCVYFLKLLLRHASFVKTVFYVTMSGWIKLTYFFYSFSVNRTQQTEQYETRAIKATMTPWTLRTTVHITNPFRSPRVHNSISDSTKYHGVLRLNLTANLTALFRRQFKCL